MAHSLDKSLLAQLELQKVLFAHGVKDVPMPDISDKAKAQEYIGLDMKTLQENKDKWIKTVVPEWLKTAKEKGRIVASL